MKALRFLYLPLLILLYSMPLMAQESHSPASHDHARDPHQYHLGVGLAATHVFAENGLAPGFHLHLIRQLGRQAKWGVGLGYETIADENWHHGLTLLVNYRLLSFISLQAGPGLVVGRHDGKLEILPAFHTELVFEFYFHGLHVGPMMGYGRDKEDSHFSVGAHVDFGF
ncbi:MAG: hypothetical protein ACYDH0_11625 [Candidatus Aminicenantales bacterium]